MLPWLLAAVTLAAVVLTAPLLGRHLFEVFDERPQPAWDRWLKPSEDALLRWIGDAGRSAESAAGYLAPLLISNALFAAVALALLLVQPSLLNPREAREPTRPSPSQRVRPGITRAGAHSGGAPTMRHTTGELDGAARTPSRNSRERYASSVSRVLKSRAASPEPGSQPRRSSPEHLFSQT
jgi:hypothetical protein